jgi:caffeoyl-CoA O-methyltransferase
MNQDIFASVDKYIDGLFGGQDAILQEVANNIEKAGLPAISISPAQGRFLHLIAKLCKAKKILELGTLGGYSTIWMARALPGDGKLISLELDPAHAKVAGQNIDRAGLGSVVEIRVGKALDLLPVIEQEGVAPFDLIFIDADKQPYATYFQWALKLSRPGTLIIADNVVRDGKVVDPDSKDEMVIGVQKLNKLLGETSAVTGAIIQTVGLKEHDGMAFALVN